MLVCLITECCSNIINPLLTVINNLFGSCSNQCSYRTLETMNVPVFNVVIRVPSNVLECHLMFLKVLKTLFFNLGFIMNIVKCISRTYSHL